MIIQPSDYTCIRTTLMELHTKILNVINSDDIKTCGRHLGLLHKKTLAFSNETEMSILQDYETYSYRPHGFNMAEKYLRINRNHLDEFNLALLIHMSKAYYSAFVVDEVVREGELRVREVFKGNLFTLLDNGLSKSVQSGFGFSGHMLQFNDFAMQTGGIMSIDRRLMDAEEVVQFFNNSHHNPESDDLLLNQKINAKLARSMISAAIRLGYTSKMKYQ